MLDLSKVRNKNRTNVLSNSIIGGLTLKSYLNIFLKKTSKRIFERY